MPGAHLTTKVNVKIIIEGQEEIGSPHMAECIKTHKELLSCDCILNTDTSQYSEDIPALMSGLRGICALQIDVRGGNSDLHSGVHGGTAPNPIDFLCKLMSGMKTPEGKVLVDGFYDDVAPISALRHKQIEAIPFNDDEYRAQYGLKALIGEEGYLARERNWNRPTLEFNGIWGGFQGEGVKTVLPALAHAKLTCRLVPNQTPEKILGLLKTHIAKYAPHQVEVTATVIGGTGNPYALPDNHKENLLLAKILKEVYGREPVFMGTGGSIPIVGMFYDIMGVHSIGMGFGLDDENLHAPNEFFRLSSFRKGMQVYCGFLIALGQQS
ncbi:hypothetical protein CHS0354_035307 [Potamilus streckersoni]|uniref:Peptidase M20 dimerisation domain-containing protein n=1 Tax=Potamilus streckersoni TaxID=2493646 RepID=A0AAE0S2L7_9BIVA|nr:hypothetical protein CHS0354_035307 [Potamilus streckersoni]